MYTAYGGKGRSRAPWDAAVVRFICDGCDTLGVQGPKEWSFRGQILFMC